MTHLLAQFVRKTRLHVFTQYRNEQNPLNHQMKRKKKVLALVKSKKAYRQPVGTLFRK